jgi:hypothetical protein
VQVAVPEDLRVSEANVFFPIADIVWRGEARGDRHLQVKAIYEEAAAVATSGMTKGPEAIVQLEITRFHCLTEKTRYTVGGVHSLHFRMTVRDAATGAVLDGPRDVVADVKAAGGATAINEDQQGRTQRVVIVERLVQVLRRELSVPAARPSGPAPEVISGLGPDLAVRLAAGPSTRLDSGLRLTLATSNQ